MRRHPDAANLSTWSVISGAVILVLLFLGSARAGNGMAGLALVVVLVAYSLLLAVVARLNIVQILWGTAVDEQDPNVRTDIVVPLTIAIVVIAYGALAWDLLSSETWGWFAPIAALVATAYLVSLMVAMRGAPRDETREEDA